MVQVITTWGILPWLESLMNCVVARSVAKMKT